MKASARDGQLRRTSERNTMTDDDVVRLIAVILFLIVAFMFLLAVVNP